MYIALLLGESNELWDTSSHGTIDYCPPKILCGCELCLSFPVLARLRMSGSNCTRPSFFFRTVGLQSWRPPILGDGHQSIRHRKIPIKGFPWHGMTHFYLFDMAWIWSFQHGASACFFQVRANLQVECERRLQEAKCGRAMEDPDFKLGRGPFLEK